MKTAILTIMACALCACGDKKETAKQNTSVAGVDGVISKSTTTYHKVDLSPCSTLEITVKGDAAGGTRFRLLHGDLTIGNGDAVPSDVEIICRVVTK